MDVGTVMVETHRQGQPRGCLCRCGCWEGFLKEVVSVGEQLRTRQ